MKIYEIVVGNNLSDSTYSVLLMSADLPSEAEANHVLSLETSWEFVVQVKIPKVIINPWTQQENEEMLFLKSKYF